MPKSGVYETYYGNACEYDAGQSQAFDIDAAELIPIELVEFSKFIRPFDKSEL